LLRQQILSLVDVADEEIEVRQVLKHFRNAQIDEHASDLWRFYLTDKVDDESEDGRADVLLNTRVRRRDSRQNFRSFCVEVMAHRVHRRLEYPLVRINSGWCQSNLLRDLRHGSRLINWNLVELLLGITWLVWLALETLALGWIATTTTTTLMTL